MAERLYQRFEVNYLTTIMTKDGTYTGIIENISLGGFYLRINNPITVGETIAVKIDFEKCEKTTNIVTNATVVRIEKDGIAFKFENMDKYNYWTLHSYLHHVDA